MRCCICLTACKGHIPLCGICKTLLPRAPQEGLPEHKHLTGVFAPFRYEFPLTSWIHQFKLNGLPGMATWLARLLVETPIPENTGSLIVPVPIHESRQRERGFNQSTLVARQYARLAGKPFADVLQKIHPTSSQRGLDRWQRKRNLTGSFSVTKQPSVDAEHILLIDDVVTTGSTGEELASVLRAAGASSVSLLALARALPVAQATGSCEL
jgi:competence protein ComFC